MGSSPERSPHSSSNDLAAVGASTPAPVEEAIRSHPPVSDLVETIKDSMTLKFVHPPDAKTQEALAALLELSHLADLRQKERAGWEIRTMTAETHAQRLEEQFEAMRSQAEEIITLRDASVAKRTVWLSQWGEAGWSADLGRAATNPASRSSDE